MCIRDSLDMASAPADTNAQFLSFLGAVDLPSARHAELESLSVPHKWSLVQSFKAGTEKTFWGAVLCASPSANQVEALEAVLSVVSKEALVEFLDADGIDKLSTVLQTSLAKPFEQSDAADKAVQAAVLLSLIHISEPTRPY
eukprot:TRINITY_DN39090_c0_g2_i1.p1 TRINITY_DN39090_c0_g2~~TRINITY_DN39090_c0_g2_i1.p1  ORF type:complete len:142 (+),score=45.38 TRINITY_DN39090_c0_g2_i1:106-531(+)